MAATANTAKSPLSPQGRPFPASVLGQASQGSGTLQCYNSPDLSSGCYNKIPQTSWLINTRNLFQSAAGWKFEIRMPTHPSIFILQSQYNFEDPHPSCRHTIKPSYDRRAWSAISFIKPLIPFSEGNGNTLQYCCLENLMNRGAWLATVHGVTRVGHELATKPPPPSTPFRNSHERSPPKVRVSSPVMVKHMNLGVYKHVQTTA